MNRSLSKSPTRGGVSKSSQKPLLLEPKSALSLVARRLSIFFALTAVSLFVGLCGCGTLGGSDQIISVDSTHRGTPVYDSRGRKIGKTPFFVKLKRLQPRPLHEGRISERAKSKFVELSVQPVLGGREYSISILGSAVGGATLFGALPSFIFTVVLALQSTR